MFVIMGIIRRLREMLDVMCSDICDRNQDLWIMICDANQMDMILYD